MSVGIYVGITSLALVLCLWTLLTSVFGDPEHARGHRLVTGVVAASVLLITPIAALAPMLGMPRLVWAGIALPVLFLVATWSNVVTLRGGGTLATLFGLPVAIFNTLHVGIYTIWCLQECFGVSLGTWGCALAAGDAHLQALLGDASAHDNPVFLRLPILVPLWNRLGLFRTGTLVAAAAYATGLLLAFGMMMPQAFRHSESYHEASAPAIALKRPLGLKVPWGQPGLSPVDYERIRLHSRLLGARRAAFTVDRTTFQDPEAVQQIRKELDWARSEGLETIAIVQPTDQFDALAASTLRSLHEDMIPAQRMTAERLRPDVLVLFAGPYGRLAKLIAGRATPVEWRKAIETSARIARDVQPSIRLGVTIDRCDAQSEGLFHYLRGGNSPVSIVGLSVFPEARLVQDLELDLARIGRWLEKGGAREVMVLEAGSCPPNHGGDRGHWNFLARVLAFAEKHRAITGVCVDALYDNARNFGLVHWSGRRRLSYFKLLETATMRKATPGPGTPGK